MTEAECYDPLLLRVQSNESCLPVAMGFAESAAQTLGLGHSGALALRLATEEIFMHLCKVLLPENSVEIICSGGGYFVELSFLSRGRIPLHTFNLTTTVSLDDEQALDEVGLLLASRSVDRFEIREQSHGRFRLSLIKEKSYPPAPREALPPLDALNGCTVRAPDGEELKLFARRVFGRYPAHLVPDFFTYPGKVVDMVMQGDFQALLAVDNNRQVAGGIMWHRSGTQLIEFFGPYQFSAERPAAIKEDLLEAFLMEIGKSDVVGAYCRLAAESVPAAYFEELGNLDIITEEDTRISVPVYFRQIQEDPGAVVWCHEDLEDFLTDAYGRLFLPRRIERAHGMGETLAKGSVLAAHLDRFQKIVVLRAIQLGMDMDRNLAEHVKLMRRESFKNIFFELDLGVSWQAHLVPSLLHNDFVPNLVVPHGGESDLVIFRWDGGKYA